MRALACTLALILLVSAVLAQPYIAEDEQGYETAEDDYARPYGPLDVFPSVERRSWCAEWGDYCRPNAKKKYARCCGNLRCACGLLWGRSRCTCKGKIFGR